MKPKPYLREISLKQDKPIDIARHPFNIGSVRNLGRLQFHPDVTFIVGENGTGKSTLLEAIAVGLGLNAEGGTRSFQFTTRASHSDLYLHLKIVRSFAKPRDSYFLRAESFFNVATEIERLDQEGGCGEPIINAYGGHSLHAQSHGESFLALLHHRFRGRGLYVLDEPEAALSPSRQLDVLRRIHQLVEQDSQFIIATHSPILMAYPRAQIFVLDGNEIVETRYESTEHYQVSHQFLNAPHHALEALLGISPKIVDL